MEGSSTGKRLIHCLSVHVTGETEELVQERFETAAKMVKDGSIPPTLPQGIQILVNHGDGGGP